MTACFVGHVLTCGLTVRTRLLLWSEGEGGSSSSSSSLGSVESVLVAPPPPPASQPSAPLCPPHQPSAPQSSDGQLVRRLEFDQSSLWLDDGREEGGMRPLIGRLDESGAQAAGSSGTGRLLLFLF